MKMEHRNELYLGFEFLFVIPDLRCDFAVADNNDTHRNEIIPEPKNECENLVRLRLSHVIEGATRQITL